jgi:hypothetical protein
MSKVEPTGLSGELTRYEIYVDKDGKIQADKWVGNKWNKVGEAAAALAERDAEIKRLREMLSLIAKSSIIYGPDIAKEALEGKC